MASRSEDESAAESVVRRTRSGRAVKPPVSSSSHKTKKTTSRRKSSPYADVPYVGDDIIRNMLNRPVPPNDSNGLSHITEGNVESEEEPQFEESVDEQPLRDHLIEETPTDQQSESETSEQNQSMEYVPNAAASSHTAINSEEADDDSSNTSESEMDADEENVDNEILEISGEGRDLHDAQVQSGDDHDNGDNEDQDENDESEDQMESPDRIESFSGKHITGDSSINGDEAMEESESDGVAEEEEEDHDPVDLPMEVDSLDQSRDRSVNERAAEDRSVHETSEDASVHETSEDRLVLNTTSTSVDKSALETSPQDKSDPDTEMVSEDELPAPPQAKVPDDAEEVSDDELPGPKLAELPADTEVVSEDELPTVKAAKRKHEEEPGYDPSSPTEAQDSASASKRPTLDATVEDKDDKDDKKAVVKPRKLPELDKYWKAVRDDPSDFTGWTYLLQYVDQENEIEPAREAYDAFLAHYPYCYGYWRKYADYEKRKGNKKKCEEVFDRGLRAIPLSVDLWLHFLAYQKATYADDENKIREQYERAVNACGLEFRSDRLWEGYIKWEIEGKRPRKVMELYDRVLVVPTFGYISHFDSLQEFVSNNQPPAILSQEEFIALRAQSRADKEAPVDSSIPPGEDEAADNMRNEEETEAIRQLIIEERRKLHKSNTTEVTSRWSFEEGIKRPYFHVKPLERCQLNNWKDYLDFETQNGTRHRVLMLYERCLIACALYEEFWLRLIRYLELQRDESLAAHTRDVFERACNVHHPDKPTLHLLWAAFEENNNQHNKAAEILVHIEKTCPNVLQIAYRRINLERRRGDYEKCSSLFEHYIQTLKNKSIVAGLVIKYARFCHKILGDMNRAADVLKAGIERDPSNARLSLQLIDLYMQRTELDVKEIVDVLEAFLDREPDPDQRVLFAQRKLEFLEDYGTAESLQDAQRCLQQALMKANKKKDPKRDSSPSKKQKDGPAPPLPPANSYPGPSGSQYGSPYNASQSSAVAGASAYGAYPAHGSYGQGYPQAGGEYPPYQWGQYPQGQYGGYGAWGSYPSYY